MLKDFIDYYMEEYLFNLDNPYFLKINLFILFIITVIFIVVFVKNEYYLVTRKTSKVMELDNKINKNYTFEDFLMYNITFIMFGTLIILITGVCVIVLQAIIPMILILLLLLQLLVVSVNWWLLIPLGLLLLKFTLYKISLRYKK